MKIHTHVASKRFRLSCNADRVAHRQREIYQAHGVSAVCPARYTMPTQSSVRPSEVLRGDGTPTEDLTSVYLCSGDVSSGVSVFWGRVGQCLRVLGTCRVVLFVLSVTGPGPPQETEHGYEWDNFSPYTCTVTSPKKETKMKGLKSFIAYQLVPSFSNIQVGGADRHAAPALALWLPEWLTS